MLDLACKEARSVLAWLDKLPPSPLSFFDTKTAREFDAIIYADWLGWYDHVADALAEWIEKYEVDYRRLGLKYHNIPHFERHKKRLSIGSGWPSRNPSGSILHALSVIFESDQPRADQRFFNNWRAATDKISEIKAMCSAITTDNVARSTLELHLDDIESRLQLASDSVDLVETQLIGLKENMKALINHYNGYTDSDLTDGIGIEGMLYRRWVHTFDEVKNRTRDLESVEKILRLQGAGKSIEWRGRASKTTTEKRKPVGEVSDLGRMWERRRWENSSSDE